MRLHVVCCLSALWFTALMFGQAPAANTEAPLEPLPPDLPVTYDADAKALILARAYLDGGDNARGAVMEALQLMGWGLRDAKGAVLSQPPAGANTGLALRDYELEELLWNPSEQPSIRLISFAQALAVPFEDADAEELAQDIVDTLRASAESDQPQQRFWARFIIALGKVGPAGYDLAGTAPMPVIPPGSEQLRQIAEAAEQNPFALLSLSAPTPVWPEDDPVLAPSPLPERAEDDTRPDAAERDQRRMNELTEAMEPLFAEMGSGDPERQRVAQEKLAKLSAELQAITQRQQAGMMQQMAAFAQRFGQAQGDDEEDEDEDETNDEPRFQADWRDQPLSLLQISLITRVLAADIRLASSGGIRGGRLVWTRSRAPLPLAMLGLPRTTAQSFGEQFSGAAGDIWATGWGAYTGAVLDHHLPDSKFSKGAGIANTIIAWYKTIMTVARQKITIDVENAPLVRTKTRSPGEQRTARCKVEIDFPKSDVLKALRAAGNLTTIDLQLPDGGAVSGAKVVWRLPEGSYNTKYQKAKGGWEYRPDLAVVQFAAAGGKAAYVSTTNDAGEATITIEGVPQKRQLPPSVRPYPRRAVIAVEVTVKVGNLTQDLNDAINTAMGGPIGGGLGFIADMVLRTSFFFQKGRVFEVTDWKEPAWEGEFEIIAKASGSEYKKGEKGGPATEYRWSMDRYIEGRMHTPEWAEEVEEEREYENDGRHRLDIDGDTRYFRLSDSSSAKTKDSHNRYEATGPLQIRPPAQNQLALYSRAEPSGSASLIFNGGFMTLEINPFFGAECLVKRSEQSKGRSSNKVGPEYLSLLNGIYPEEFRIIEPNDGTQDYVEGSKTFENLGSLPFVPNFDVTVTIKYRLWKNGPPPKNRGT